MLVRVSAWLAAELTKRRLIGLGLFSLLLALFLALNRVPKLDIVSADLAAVSGPSAKCFQGFCVDSSSDSGLLSRWWGFSVTYLRLVAVGMTFAFVVAGLVEAFLLPGLGGHNFSSKGIRGSLKGMLVGGAMTLCSACIVPVSAAFRRRGAGTETTLSIVQASSILNLPSLIMIAAVFSPVLVGSRVVLGVVGVLLIGPLVSMVIGERDRSSGSSSTGLEPAGWRSSSWSTELKDGLRDWARASLRYVLRLGPVMVLAGFVSGLAIQWINPERIAAFMGDSLLAIAVAATLGILINVPLMFEIPLVAALMLVGMGTAPAATLLFTAAAAGPVTFWGLAQVMSKRVVVLFGATTWILGVAGGVLVLLLGTVMSNTSGSTARLMADSRTISAPFLQSTPVRDGAPARENQIVENSAASEYPLDPTVRFVDVTEAAGVTYLQYTLRPDGQCLLGNFCHPERQSGGAAAADYDNDGYVDIYVSRLDGPDILFRNLGNGRFENASSSAGLDGFNLRSNGVAWFDADNDGDMDLYVTTIGDTRFYMFINDGNGRFTEEAISRGAAIETAYQHSGFSIAVGDYDRDGWVDLHVNEWGSSRLLPEGALSHARLLRNRGPAAPGHFEDRTVQAGVVLDEVKSQDETAIAMASIGQESRGPFAFASAFVDLDSDGWPDLAIVSDNGHTRLFWNNGDGTFTDGTIRARIGSDRNGMGSTFGDYDADGDLDWFVSAIYREVEACTGDNCDTRGATGNRLYRNEGGRLFGDATDATGVRDGGWGWGAVFLDYDNNGDLDLAMVGGMHHSDLVSQSELEYPRLWDNDGNGRMREIAGLVGLVHRSAAKSLLTLDYDRDGDLDLFVVNNGGTPRLYRNDGGNANAWLRVRLIGERTNRSGIGATIVVTSVSGGRSQLREMGVASHFLGQNELVSHFGLGSEIRTVDQVTIRWPRSGELTVLRDVPINVTIVVREGQGDFEVDSP